MGIFEPRTENAQDVFALIDLPHGGLVALLQGSALLRDDLVGSLPHCAHDGLHTLYAPAWNRIEDHITKPRWKFGSQDPNRHGEQPEDSQGIDRWAGNNKVGMQCSEWMTGKDECLQE